MNDASTAAFPPAMSDCPEVIAKVTSELAAIANDVGLGAPHREVPLACYDCESTGRLQEPDSPDAVQRAMMTLSWPSSH